MDANRHLLSIILLLVALALTGCVVINMPPDDEGADISTTTDPSGTEGDSTGETDDGEETTDTTGEVLPDMPADESGTDSTDTTGETTDTGEFVEGCCCCDIGVCEQWPMNRYPAGEESCEAYLVASGCAARDWQPECLLVDGVVVCPMAC
jgi:hypothetical protein